MLRWWGLCGYRWEGINEFCLYYKLKCGQTGLARRVFEDALSSNNVAASFNDAVTTIKDEGGIVTVTIASGRSYTAPKAICTIPLNVLKTIKFDPPLDEGKTAAAAEGHIDLCRKLHAEVGGVEWKSWSGTSYPGAGLIAAYGDGTTPAGNTHIVAFGCAEIPIECTNVEQNKGAFLHYQPKWDIKRLVFHDWNEDPYARGVWCMFSPNFATKYLSVLQQDHGNVLFANSDWADGWRGFVDGAMEQGMRAAQKVASGFEAARHK
jgi:monoamine oxidase